MKKEFVITKAEDVTKVQDFETKTIKVFAEGGEAMECSDGYHTFSELYEHRITLFIALCRQLTIHSDNNDQNMPWKSKLHSDGSSFEGWFIMGIGIKKDSQITYHLPMSKWEETQFAQELEKAPEWDGHTPEDVLKRISIL